MVDGRFVTIKYRMCFDLNDAEWQTSLRFTQRLLRWNGAARHWNYSAAAYLQQDDAAGEPSHSADEMAEEAKERSQ